MKMQLTETEERVENEKKKYDKLLESMTPGRTSDIDFSDKLLRQSNKELEEELI